VKQNEHVDTKLVWGDGEFVPASATELRLLN